MGEYVVAKFYSKAVLMGGFSYFCTPTLPDMNLRLLTLPLLILPPLCFAQYAPITPTKDSTLICFHYSSPDSLNPEIPEFVLDTSADLFHSYDPLSRNHYTALTQGNSGRPYLNLIPEYSSSPGIQLGWHHYDNYLFNPNKIKYFRSFYPFTLLSYTMGAHREQLFELIHTQQIGRLLSLDLDFRIINSPGAYTQQKSDHSNFSAALSFIGKNRRYTANAGLINNLLKTEENGGIDGDSLFEKNLETNREIIPVHLYEATNRYWENTLFCNQEFSFLNSRRQPTDTVTIKSPEIVKYLPLKIRHFISWKRSSFLYDEDDPTNDFYPYPPLDTVQTADETDFNDFRTGITLYNSTNPAIPLRYYAKLNFRKAEISDTLSKTTVNQWNTGFGIEIDLPFKISAGMQMERTAGDYNNGDATMLVRLHKKCGKSFLINAEWATTVSEPGWYLQHMQSNHYQWTNNLASIHRQRISGKLSFKGYTFGFAMYGTKNPVVFPDTTCLPVQLDKTLILNHIFFEKIFRFEKLRFDNRLSYFQTSNEIYQPVPEIISRHALYFDLLIFGKALVFQPGIELNFISSWFPYGWMPPTRSFYLQHEKKVNDQYYLDVFINLKVKRARLFLKYQHFNALWGPWNYYQVLNYPLQDAAFKFGISWLLRDPPLPKAKKIN